MLYISPFITVYCCVLAALLGACMSSFIACMCWRIAHGESVLRGRSHCDYCGHTLGVRDLFPIFSYIFSGGKCRYCGAKLSFGHLAGEILGAVLFVAVLLKFDITLTTLTMLLFICILLACSFSDLNGCKIPNGFIIAGIVLRAVSLLFCEDKAAEATDALLGGFAISAAVLFVSFILGKILRRAVLCEGGIKLLFVTGLFLGWEKNLLCLIVACLFGVIFVLAAKKREFPLAPFISGGAVVALIFGDAIINIIK